jgi:hypothetical protein
MSRVSHATPQFLSGRGSPGTSRSMTGRMSASKSQPWSSSARIGVISSQGFPRGFQRASHHAPLWVSHRHAAQLSAHACEHASTTLPLPLRRPRPPHSPQCPKCTISRITERDAPAISVPVTAVGQGVKAGTVGSLNSRSAAIEKSRLFSAIQAATSAPLRHRCANSHPRPTRAVRCDAEERLDEELGKMPKANGIW